MGMSVDFVLILAGSNISRDTDYSVYLSSIQRRIG
jgi:hypothetical protein